VTQHSITLEADGPGSYRFKFATARGEISGRVQVGREGPPDKRTEAEIGRASCRERV